MASFTVEEALAHIGVGRFHYMLLFLCGLGFASGTVELILVSILNPELGKEWPEFDVTLKGLFVSLTFIGEIIGGIIWGFISDKYGKQSPIISGRKIVFKTTALVSSIFGLASAFAPNPAVMLVLRFFLGVAIGGNLSIDVIFFMEFLPAHKRGKQTVTIILCGIGGFLLTALLGWQIVPNFGWRWFLIACTIPSIILFISRMFFHFESPRFLLTRGRNKELAESLIKIALINGKTLPDDFEITNPKELDDEKHVEPKIADIFRGEYFRQSILLCLVWFFHVFAYYGLLVWLPKFTESKKITNLNISLHFLFVGLAELPGLLFTVLAIERIGRKWTLFINFCGAAITTFVFAFSESQVTVLIFSGCIYFFVVGIWAILYIFTPELYPTTHRAAAFGMVGLFAKVGGVIVSPIIGAMWKVAVPPFWILFTCFVCFIFAGLATLGIRKETKQKVLLDF